MKKRLIIGLAIGTAVFAIVFATAASLGGITADDLGADNADVLTCESTPGVTTSYTTAFTGGVYVVDSVTVGNINDACEGDDITVTLADGTTELATASGTVPVDAGTTDDNAITFTTPDFSGTATAEAVNDVHVVIATP